MELSILFMTALIMSASSIASTSPKQLSSTDIAAAFKAAGYSLKGKEWRTECGLQITKDDEMVIAQALLRKQEMSMAMDGWKQLSPKAAWPATEWLVSDSTSSANKLTVAGNQYLQTAVMCIS